MKTLEWISLTVTDSSEIITYDGHKTDKTLLEAAKYTVTRIIDNFPAPYNLLCSGGVDSQAMLFAWSNFAPKQVLDKTTIHTFVYNDRCNLHDIHNVQELAETYNLPLIYHDFDLMNFLESGECFQIQKKYITASPQIASYIKFFQSFKTGTHIMSGNPIMTERLDFAPEHVSLIRYAKYNYQPDNVPIPFFFMDNRHIGMSILSLSDSESKVITEKSKDFYDMKCDFLKYYGFRITPQPEKYTGFENFKPIYESKHPPTFREKISCASEPSKWSFDIHHRYMVRKKLGQGQFIIKGNEYLK